MDTPRSFDVAFLGLKDPSSAGRARMVLVMERLTGRSTADCQEYLKKVGLTIFDSLPSDQARLISTALDDAGVIFEIRPKEEIARAAGEAPGGGMAACPSCGFVQQADLDECSRCGVIFSKMEKDEVRQMQTDQALEEAVQRAEQIRQEWDDRARQLIEGRPLPEGAVEPFRQVLTQEEIPFLVLESADGPILLTSRQIIGTVEGSFAFVPYEIIKDVDFGGGLVVKKSHTRLVLHFHCPIPFNEKNVSSLSWQLTADAATNKETIMDWAFARSYMCGACGARDLDFRPERGETHARCMHCATDHNIDVRNHKITPVISG
jgi:predicted Zn-ribbon and HTH transcriptional regulator